MFCKNCGQEIDDKAVICPHHIVECLRKTTLQYLTAAVLDGAFLDVVFQLLA